MRKLTKISAMLLLSAFAFGACAGCGDDPAKDGKTEVILWGYADDEAAETLDEITKYYNENNTDNIYLTYRPQPSGTYVSLAERLRAPSSRPYLFAI